MAKTPSTMLPLGTPAANFVLPDGAGATTRLEDYRGRGLVVMFICNHCPFVKHLRQALADFGRTYLAYGLGVVAINSNDSAAYPDDAPEAMLAESKAAGYTFPYLVDASQDVARAYKAACTPDFYLFDAKHTLVYRGQFDGSRPGNGQPITGHDLRAACDALLAGKAVASEQMPSIGCNIKWKA